MFFAGRGGADALDGGDRMPDGGAHRHHAGSPRDAVQVHGAGATERDAATELGAVHAEQIAQDPEQGHVRRRVDLVRLAIDSQSDHGLAECISWAESCTVLGSSQFLLQWGAEDSGFAEKSSVRCFGADRSDRNSGASIVSSGCGSLTIGSDGERRSTSFAPRA